jgi:thymidylate kinase
MHIIFEGPDGAGKSTLINALLDKLTGKRVLLAQQPGTTEIGKQLRAILKGPLPIHPMTRQAMHMADTSEFNACIASLSSQYDYIIQDRTSFISSPIYGKAERGTCDYHIDWYKHVTTHQADKLFIILSKKAEEQTRKRGDGDHFDKKDTSFHQTVYQEYVKFATDPECAVYTDLIVNRANLHIIYTDGTIDDAVTQIVSILELDL